MRRLRDAAEFADVGAGDEAAGLAERITRPLRRLALDRSQHVVEFGQHVLRQRVGAGALLVEHQPGDAVVVAARAANAAMGPAPCGASSTRERAELQIARPSNARAGFGAGDFVIGALYTVSISMAPPCPPPMHSVAMPRLWPSRFMALTRCSTMRLPLAPTGWPSADRAAVDIELVARDRAGGALEAQRLAAELVVLPGGETGQHLRGERLVQLPQLDVAELRAVPPQERGRAQHRAEPHDRRIERRPFAVDDDRRGVSPCFFTASSDARITQDAPSVICELLPAVTLPQGRSNAGFSLASVSTVLSGRTPSS